jgi:hypothetical protein
MNPFLAEIINSNKDKITFSKFHITTKLVLGLQVIMISLVVISFYVLVYNCNHEEVLGNDMVRISL